MVFIWDPQHKVLRNCVQKDYTQSYHKGKTTWNDPFLNISPKLLRSGISTMLWQSRSMSQGNKRKALWTSLSCGPLGVICTWWEFSAERGRGNEGWNMSSSQKWQQTMTGNTLHAAHPVIICSHPSSLLCFSHRNICHPPPTSTPSPVSRDLEPVTIWAACLFPGKEGQFA